MKEVKGPVEVGGWGGQHLGVGHARRRVLRWWWQVVDEDGQEPLVFSLRSVSGLSVMDVTTLQGRTWL